MEFKGSGGKNSNGFLEPMFSFLSSAGVSNPRAAASTLFAAGITTPDLLNESADATFLSQVIKLSPLDALKISNHIRSNAQIRPITIEKTPISPAGLHQQSINTGGHQYVYGLIVNIGSLPRELGVVGVPTAPVPEASLPGPDETLGVGLEAFLAGDVSNLGTLFHPGHVKLDHCKRRSAGNYRLLRREHLYEFVFRASDERFFGRPTRIANCVQLLTLRQADTILGREIAFNGNYVNIPDSVALRFGNRYVDTSVAGAPLRAILPDTRFVQTKGNRHALVRANSLAWRECFRETTPAPSLRAVYECSIHPRNYKQESEPEPIPEDEPIRMDTPPVSDSFTPGMLMCSSPPLPEPSNLRSESPPLELSLQELPESNFMREIIMAEADFRRGGIEYEEGCPWGAPVRVPTFSSPMLRENF